MPRGHKKRAPNTSVLFFILYKEGGTYKVISSVAPLG